MTCLIIKEIYYKDLSNGLIIDHIKIDNRKVLLVGNSGAGKTKILQAMNDACRLASGRLKTVTSSFELELKFIIEENKASDCVWKIKVDSLPIVAAEETNISIKEESLVINRKQVFIRNGNQIKILNYDSVPQPKENESLISQYREKNEIKLIYAEFRKVYLRIFERDMLVLTNSDLYQAICDFYKGKKFCPFEFFSKWNMTPFDQFGVIKEVASEIYMKIHKNVLEVYQEAFTDVEDISYLPNDFNQYGIAIKTDGHWITQTDISSGMLKSLWNLINIELMPRGAVVLIDELENGLGINCVENVSDFIMNNRSDIQILTTSHHPYIINSISMEHWIIVQRKKQVVKSYNAKEMSLGESRHDAYLKLVNRLQN